MKKEKSCGAVVYKIENNQILFLIEKMNHGHFSMPKGHVENNETEIQTALREIKEETNLDVTLDSSFRQVITYAPYQDCLKDVVFFIAKAKSGKIKNQECEVSKIEFLPFDKAIKTLTYKYDKEVLLKAYLYLIKKLIKKIIIIGCPGSGKSYLSKVLAKSLNLPLYHIDMLYWYDDWKHITNEQLKEKLSEITNGKKWIIDGNYSNTLKDRIDKAELVIYMNLATKTCLKGYYSRLNNKRDDMPLTCVEKVDEEFVNYIKTFKKTKGKKIKKMINNKNVLTITNVKDRKDIEDILTKM